MRNSMDQTFVLILPFLDDGHILVTTAILLFSCHEQNAMDLLPSLSSIGQVSLTT